MSNQEDKSKEKKMPLNYPFITPSQFTQPGKQISQGSWQMSQLKKTAENTVIDNILPTARDKSDTFQVIKEVEDHPEFKDSGDGLKKESDIEETDIEGEEEFRDSKDLEDDELWEDEEDYFQDLEERNALLEEMLRERIESPFPPVHSQIMKLCEAITNKEKMLKPLSFYVNEIDSYIKKKINIFSNLPKVDNEAITRSNQLMIDGLNLLTDACNSLRSYIDDEGPHHIEIVKRLAVQANEFFSEGKQLLLSVKIQEKGE